VKHFLDTLCNYLGSYKGACDNLVDAYFPVIVYDIDQKLSNPDQTCTNLGLCKTGSFLIKGLLFFPPTFRKVRQIQQPKNSELMHFMNRMGRVQTRSGSSTGCTVCVYSFTAILDTLKFDRQLLQSWADGIQNICKMFPTDLQPGCNDFLSIYLEPVLRVTIDSISARDICNLLHACSSSKFERPLLRAQPKGVNGPIVCESCRLLAEFLKNQFQDKSFRDEIQQEIKYICDLVPGVYADQCDNIVDNYIPRMFDSLVAELNPDTACPAMKMCSPRKFPKLEKGKNLV